MHTVFDNYEAFYNMILSTTIMSNAQTPEFEADAQKIINYIGKAYRLKTPFIEKCKTIILDQLVSLSLTTEQRAVYSSRKYGDNYSDKDVLFDIKGDVLTKLQSMSNTNSLEINPSWFDYSHYKTYKANVRFAKIYTTSATGDLTATRQVGILQSLGIGCTVNYPEAIRRLSQCVFWGDMASMYYLAYTYLLANNKVKASFFYELADLSNKYLKTGCTVLPDEVKSAYSEEVRTYYVYISTIRQDIIYAYNKCAIDFSFIEAINSDSLDYFQRMYFINNYEKKEWKNITNSSGKPANEIGFR